MKRCDRRACLVLIAVAVALSTLADAFAADNPVDDEAMVRAKKTHLSPEGAAYQYYYPDYIDNYFAGMDAIAVLRLAETGENVPVNQFATPIYQLMDKAPPGGVVKLDPIRLPTDQATGKEKAVRIDKTKQSRQYCHDIRTEAPGACEVLGRNTWMMWTGGNEGFWDWLGRHFGILDFLNLLDTREVGDANASRRKDREGRFARAGLINEPSMGPSIDEDDNVIERVLGLRLDEPLDKEVRDWRRKYVVKALNLSPDPAPENSGAAPAYGSYGGSSEYRGVLSGKAVGYPNGRDYDPRIPPPEIYGLSSGVVGLRLFPNPKFDREALERWLKTKDSYAKDPVGDPSIVRPFRVGMSCAFCHASFHPLNPPADVANPKWENISGNIGAQYLRLSAVFGNLLAKDNFVFHILDSQPPGTVDTSLVASDNINNPNTMNSVFNLAQRVLISLRNPKEQLSKATLPTPSLWGDPDNRPPDMALTSVDLKNPPSDPLKKLIVDYWKAAYASGGGPSDAELKIFADEVVKSNDPLRRVPRILLDGSDSIGAWGALARVYLNIGTNYEQWNELHDPVVGLSPQKPFTIANAELHSGYWWATKLRVGPLRDYFLKISPSMPLITAALPVESAAPIDGGVPASGGARPGSIRALAKDRNIVDYKQLEQGRRVFAQNCIACHSSVQPAMRHEKLETDAVQTGSKDHTEFFDHDPGQLMRNPKYKEYQDWAIKAVEMEEFWRTNFFSTDYRVPVNYVKTNSCRAMATNALTGNMWQDFASESYRKLPSIGDIHYFNPYGSTKPQDLDHDQNNAVYSPRHTAPKDAPRGGGGPGFYRVPTLASIWATAPFLHNNSLGKYTADPSIRGRLEAFNDSIEKLLWREKRADTPSYGVDPKQLKEDHGLIWRTPQVTYLTIPGIYLPELLEGRSQWVRDILDRYPELRAVPEWRRPLPTAVLLLIAFLLLWRAQGGWLRWAGYVSVVLALLVGAGIYFLHGGLGGIRIGPIPVGTPVGLLANINPDADLKLLKKTLATVRDAFTEIESMHVKDERRGEIMRKKIAPALLEVSKCPDLVMDRGHYFPWFADMSDSDKKALIELLKTF